MQYEDKVFGSVNISEPVVLGLIQSPSLQRLRGIDQAGYFSPFVPGIEHSRFEHSVGVYLLLNRYRASLEEQVAGLIHDVSHAAFSHCIDYILDAGSQEQQSHQDRVFEDYVRNSEIPGIVATYNLNLDFILDDANFPLKETKLPDLCADRIDYSLRTAVVSGEADQRKVSSFLGKLKAVEGRWIFDDGESAKEYAKLFFLLNERYYAGIHTALMFNSVGEVMRHALKKGYITERDLYTTDNVVLGKVKAHLDDRKLALLYDRMNNNVSYKNDPSDYEFHVFCKSRNVDPLSLYQGKVVRLSHVDGEWRKVMETGLKPKEYFLRYER